MFSGHLGELVGGWYEKGEMQPLQHRDLHRTQLSRLHVEMGHHKNQFGLNRWKKMIGLGESGGSEWGVETVRILQRLRRWGRAATVEELNRHINVITTTT